VYNDFKKPAYGKNGAGRVIYFDRFMIAEASFLHLKKRKVVVRRENERMITDYSANCTECTIGK
jgi:hypothetical protein